MTGKRGCGHQQLNYISMPNIYFFFVSKEALTSSEVEQHGTISVKKNDWPKCNRIVFWGTVCSSVV